MSHICPKGAPCKISGVVFFLASSFRAFTIQSPPLKLITEDLHIRTCYTQKLKARLLTQPGFRFSDTKKPLMAAYSLLNVKRSN